VGIAPFIATGLTLTRQRGLAGPGPPARWEELSTNLALLLAASVLMQVLVNGGPLVVQAVVAPSEGAATSSFLAGLLVARVPLFLFQAVQASLLPNLAVLHATGRQTEASSALARIALVVIALGIGMTVACAALGPVVVQLVFGPDFDLSSTDMALLAAGSALVMLGLALAQALVAGGRHGLAALGWLAGVVAFVLVVVVVDSGVLLRVELAYALGALAAAASMSGLVWVATNRPPNSVGPR
jgi:O-antigen/teichoic acid export membrane protein